jgi:hypothetical protein
VRTVETALPVTNIELSRNGTWMSTCAGKEIQFWNTDKCVILPSPPSPMAAGNRFLPATWRGDYHRRPPFRVFSLHSNLFQSVSVLWFKKNSRREMLPFCAPFWFKKILYVKRGPGVSIYVVWLPIILTCLYQTLNLCIYIYVLTNHGRGRPVRPGYYPER